MPEPDGAAGRTRNQLADGLSAPSHYAAAFSSPSRIFVGRVSFHTAAVKCTYQIDRGENTNMASANALCYKALTVFFILAQNALRDRRDEKIDRSLAIVVEAA